MVIRGAAAEVKDASPLWPRGHHHVLVGNRCRKQRKTYLISSVCGVRPAQSGGVAQLGVARIGRERRGRDVTNENYRRFGARPVFSGWGAETGTVRVQLMLNGHAAIDCAGEGHFTDWLFEVVVACLPNK